MRYWHLFNPHLSIPDLLVRCLAKGLPYCISLPLPSPSNTSLPGPQQPILHIPQARNQKVSLDMVNLYLSNVQAVLSHPHAHKFLERGGLIWRIVLHYSPAVCTRAFVGPSPAAAHNSGHNEVITPSEIQTLLGVTTNNNSFWPYPEWYEMSSRYNGEWTLANETWFINHVQDIEYARDGCLRAGRAWQNTIRIHTLLMPLTPQTVVLWHMPKHAAHISLGNGQSFGRDSILRVSHSSLQWQFGRCVIAKYNDNHEQNVTWPQSALSITITLQ
jgi:hypothetical protein